jgi:uncharacterized DUF497 family protein
MLILPNPAKERLNRGKHGLDFSRVGEILASDHLDEADDRPLGYEQEGRRVITGRIGLKVVVLIIEPVVVGGEIAAKPISLRKADRDEEQEYWRAVG